MKHHTAKLTLLLLMMTPLFVINFNPIAACDNGATVVDYTPVIDTIKTEIETLRKANNVAGVSVALVDDQKVVWSQGFGYADAESKVPITSDTFFLTASVSKLFTGTAIMRLVDQGKVDLDQPLQTYLPEFKINSYFGQTRNITIRSILTHHSGLPDGHLHGEYSYDPQYQFPSVLSELKEDYVAYPPNYIYAYSNVGFALLGNVIERVTHQNFNRYMEAEILKPLGMNRSSFEIGKDMKPYLTPSFTRDNQLYNTPCFRDRADGGLYSSANEMSKFISMVFANGKSSEGLTILKRDSLSRMLTPQNYGISLDFGQPMGLAWHLADQTGKLDYAGKVANHDGGYIGYLSSLMTLPEHKLGVIVLTNSENGGNITHEIATDTLRLALEAKTGRKAPEVVEKKLPVRTLTPAEIREYTGCYGLGLLGLLEIKPNNQALCATLSGNDSTLQYHEGQWLSIPQFEGFYFKITRINNSKIIIMKSNISDYITVIGEEISAKPLPAVWNRRAGNYRIVNDPYLKGIYTPEVIVKDQFLMMRLSSNSNAMPLIPISPTNAIICGMGRSAHETVRFETSPDGKDRMVYSGLKMDKITTESESK